MSSNTHSFNREDFDKIEGSVEENPDSLSHVSYYSPKQYGNTGCGLFKWGIQN